MLQDSTMTAIHQWVAERVGAFPGDFSGAMSVSSHSAAMADYHGIYVWRMGASARVTVPGALLTRLNRPIATQWSKTGSIDAITEEAFWREALGDRVERVVGPAYQGYLDREAFKPAETRGARALTLTDHRALRQFIASCPPDAWDDSAVSTRHLPIFGVESAGELIAVASAPLDRPRKAHIRSVGVVSLPAFRGQGAGLAVVSALVDRLTAEDSIVHYQTLRANLPSIAIARRLGFADLATSLAIRLR